MEGRFSLGTGDGRTVPLRGVADRIDLLTGNRLRVIDYKTGYPPQPKRRAAGSCVRMCAQERLAEHGKDAWRVEEAAYVAFSGRRPLVSVMKHAQCPGCVIRGRTGASIRHSSTASSEESSPRGRTRPASVRTARIRRCAARITIGDE
jgi:hypothetical protein